MRQSVILEKSPRLLNHGPTVLVSSAHADKKNVMAASWSMTLDFSPPKVAVVIESSSFTRELIDKEGTFALNIPTRQLAEVTLKVGHNSGREMDKFKEFNINYFKAEKINAPLIEGCVGWLECKVIQEPHNQNEYDLFIGEIIAAHADDRAFKNGRWIQMPHELNTLHYVAGGAFFVASEMIEVKD